MEFLQSFIELSPFVLSYHSLKSKLLDGFDSWARKTVCNVNSVSSSLLSVLSDSCLSSRCQPDSSFLACRLVKALNTFVQYFPSCQRNTKVRRTSLFEFALATDKSN